MPAKLKIGWSSDVRSRLKQLFSTGIPTPFELEFLVKVSDGRHAERLAHKALERYRVAENREFFGATVPQAVEAIAAFVEPHAVLFDRIGAATTAHAKRMRELIRFAEADLAAKQSQVSELQTRISALSEADASSLKATKRYDAVVLAAENKLRKLGARPQKLKPTFMDSWRGKDVVYEAAYADLVKPWDAAEAELENLHLEIRAYLCRAAQAASRRDRDRAETTTALETARYELQLAANHLRNLRSTEIAT